MLMRNPEYKTAIENDFDSSNEAYSSREMLLGHVVWILLLAIAILLRSLTA